MSELAVVTTMDAKELALTVVMYLTEGKIEDAIGLFAEEFTFKDHGIGLEFNDKGRLFEFFRKARELYPDSSFETHTTSVSGDHVIMEWTRHVKLTEPFYGGLSWKVQVSVRGASIIRTQHSRIIEWADYYDGLKSRRNALAAHFEEWDGL